MYLCISARLLSWCKGTATNASTKSRPVDSTRVCDSTRIAMSAAWSVPLRSTTHSSVEATSFTLFHFRTRNDTMFALSTSFRTGDSSKRVWKTFVVQLLFCSFARGQPLAKLFVEILAGDFQRWCFQVVVPSAHERGNISSKIHRVQRIHIGHFP